MNPLVISWLASITSVLADILKVAAVWTACIALGGAGSAGWTLVFAKKDMFGKKDKSLEPQPRVVVRWGSSSAFPSPPRQRFFLRYIDRLRQLSGHQIAALLGVGLVLGGAALAAQPPLWLLALAGGLTAAFFAVVLAPRDGGAERRNSPDTVSKPPSARADRPRERAGV